MNASAYRIGPSDHFTTGDLEADAATLDRQIALLDDQNMEQVSQVFFDGWLAFLSEWKKFYADTFVGSFFGAGWNNGNRDQLIQFENRFGNWASQYKAESGQALPGGVIEPSTGTKDTFGDHLGNQLRPLKAFASAYWYVLAAAGVALVYVFREPLLKVAKGVG